MRFVDWPAARYMVTLRICPAVTGKEMGSEKTTAPLGTVKESDPEKVTGLREEGRMAGEPEVLFAGRAMDTAVMGRSEAPKALLICSRMVEAGWVT